MRHEENFKFSVHIADDNTDLVPIWSANCLPLSVETTLSSSRSHLLPTSTTWALSQEYVFICVHLKKQSPSQVTTAI